MIWDEEALEWLGSCQEGKGKAGWCWHLEAGFGAKEKEPGEVPAWLRGLERQPLNMGLNLPSRPCLSSGPPNRIAEAAAMVPTGSFYVSVIILSPTKIISSREEGRFGRIENCGRVSASGLIGIHKSTF